MKNNVPACCDGRLGFEMGTMGTGTVLDFGHTMAHHVPILQCCGYSMGKLPVGDINYSLFLL